MTERATEFRARLQRQYLGCSAIPMTARATLRTGSWMRFHCGDRVCAQDDPRHTGQVRAITNGVARVIWDHTSWMSEVQLNKLRSVS
jgi:hypothetical protein